MKGKKLKILISILIIILIALCVCLIVFRNKQELRPIKSEKQLKKIYYGDDYYDDEESLLLKALGMPFTYLKYKPRRYYSSRRYYDYDYDYSPSYSKSSGAASTILESIDTKVTNDYASINGASKSTSLFENSGSSSKKDYSTTNIQVENVDEADITKTDGDYIYSLSEENVIITDVRNPEKIEIASKISLYGSAPEDLLLCDGKLVVIYTETSNGRYGSNNTVVTIYDITDKKDPYAVKTFTLYEPYYTCRCIGNNLYVISSGSLRMENEEVSRYYTEDSKKKELPLDNMYYLKDVETDTQTLISKVDLSNLKQDISLNSYLIDISNAYVSENSIYLLDYDYDYSYYDDIPPVWTVFGMAGAITPFVYDNYDDYYQSYGRKSSSDYHTVIYKFDILNDGSIKYSNKAKVDGQTINQYSLDEYEGNLRVALYDTKTGSRVVVFDKNMKQIGESDCVAVGEKMYSSRFIGNKLYFVTFRTMDPLFVVDLSDPTNPDVLGELKIPGYSTYLHPYDENHIIGIGMETEEIVRRGSDGRVLSTTSSITGMKMAIFDVSNVSRPKELSHIVIGDRRTTSAILTNPKALLFSKEKELIAIPVNNYETDFEVTYSDNTSSVVSSYTNSSKSYVSEGYLVYKINLTDGFNLKGLITHENNKTSYSYYTNSRLLRGLYIDNNLYTVSETAVKVNKLDDLAPVSELKIIKSEVEDELIEKDPVVNNRVEIKEVY